VKPSSKAVTPKPKAPPVTTDDIVYRLTKACDLIESVIPHLNITAQECAHCHLVVRESPNDWKANIELTGARNKILKWVAVFNGEADEENTHS